MPLGSDPLTTIAAAFPTLLIPLLIYAMCGAVDGWGDRSVATLNDVVLAFQMPSDALFRMTWGETLILLGLVALFIDLFKSMGASASALINHGLSIGVFVLYLVLLIVAKPFGTSVFFVLTMISLVDVIAGFTISITNARRDFTIDHS